MAKSEISGEKRTIVDIRDISNSRLPSKSPRGKTKNVRFERRIAELNNLGSKNLNFRSTENHLKIVIIFEDLSRPRVIKKLVKRDRWISSILTTEESILYIWREDGQPNRVNLLYEGGQFPKFL